VVATNPLYTPREIEHQLNDAGVELMLVMSNFYKLVKQAQPKTRLKKLVVTNIKEYLPPVLRVLFTLVKEKKEGHFVEPAAEDVWLKDVLAKHTPAERPKLTIGSDDLCIFQYSGGTTGISKAAVSLHKNLVANTLQIKAFMPDLKEGNEIVLMAIPLFHVYGMVAGMSFAIASAASMVMVPNPRDMHDVLASIGKYRPTIYPGVPTMYNAINNHPDVLAKKVDVTSIRACISGSAPLLRETKERFEALTGGKLVEGYGLSEAPTATHCNPVFGETRTGSIGIPLPDVEANIISLDDGKTEMPVGEIGELAIRSPNVMKGYHNMPTETANTLRDGWLFTGDIARMDEDGYFYIVDRKRDLIISGGFNIAPSEIERVLWSHPAVADCAVIGVPDDKWGEAVKAVVELKPGASVTEAALQALCRERLGGVKMPRSVEFWEALPRSPVGKVLKRDIRQRYWAGRERAV